MAMRPQGERTDRMQSHTGENMNGCYNQVRLAAQHHNEFRFHTLLMTKSPDMSGMYGRLAWYLGGSGLARFIAPDADTAVAGALCGQLPNGANEEAQTVLQWNFQQHGRLDRC